MNIDSSELARLVKTVETGAFEEVIESAEQIESITDPNLLGDLLELANHTDGYVREIVAAPLQTILQAKCIPILFGIRHRGTMEVQDCDGVTHLLIETAKLWPKETWTQLQYCKLEFPALTAWLTQFIEL